MSAGWFSGADADGLARLAAALESAADELDRRAAALSCTVAAVDAAGEAALPLAAAARWCRTSRDDVLRRVAGFDDEAGGAWLPDTVTVPMSAAASAWAAGTAPRAVADAVDAMAAARAPGVSRAAPFLVPLSFAANVATAADGGAAPLDRAVAGVGAGADLATLYLVCTAAPGAGWVVVGVVGGAVAAYQLWRARDDVADWAASTGDAVEAAGVTADRALDAAGAWQATTAGAAADGLAAAGDDWADWADGVAADASDRGMPLLGAAAATTAAGVRWGSAGFAAAQRAGAGAVAGAVDRVGDGLAAAGRRVGGAGDWVEDRLEERVEKRGRPVPRP